MANSFLPSDSGSHPFDNEPVSHSSSDWLSHIQESRALESSQLSQSYARVEARLKERIIDGEVDFQRPPWDELPEGMVLYISREQIPSLC